jgi:hypothetical protein
MFDNFPCEMPCFNYIRQYDSSTKSLRVIPDLSRSSQRRLSKVATQTKGSPPGRHAIRFGSIPNLPHVPELRAPALRPKFVSFLLVLRRFRAFPRSSTLFHAIFQGGAPLPSRSPKLATHNS